MNNQATVEKELPTLEKDKKDQNKYFFSYPKPPFSDMKWENHGINVLEEAKTSKLLKLSFLNDIGTSLRLFKILFDDTLVIMVVGYTKLYHHREKAITSFEITSRTLPLLLGILLLNGYLKLCENKCIRRQSPIILYKEFLIQCLVTSSRKVLSNLHLCDNERLTWFTSSRWH